MTELDWILAILLLGLPFVVLAIHLYSKAILERIDALEEKMAKLEDDRVSAIQEDRDDDWKPDA